MTPPKVISTVKPYPGTQTAQADLQQGLNVIFNHPNVGPFIGSS